MTHDDLLDAALAAAASAGADAADSMVSERHALDIGWRLGALEELERKEGRELGLRVFVDGRTATGATTLLDPASIRELAQDLVASARLLPEDPWAFLASPDEVAKEIPDLDLDDPAEPAVEQLMRMAETCEAAIRAVPGVAKAEAQAWWGRLHLRLGTSNGFRGSFHRSGWSVTGEALAGSGTAMERDWAYRRTTHGTDLPEPEVIGREAGERVVRRLGPRKVDTCQVPIVFEPRVAAAFAGHITGAISGEAIANRRSFLQERLGERIAALGITVVDDPLRRRGVGSRPFDAEGIACRTRRIVDAGVLTTWLLDLSTAKRLGLASTGHATRDPAAMGRPGPTNLVIEAGTLSPQELMADIRAGLYVTELIGSGVSTVTGDYSRGAAGFWIENGEIAYPVSEITIAGNLSTMLQQMTPAYDLEIRGERDAPTIRIDGMTVAGR
ncbi:MAG: metallopeptidase TldD-related protein [Geminicoccaceae bacterium]